MPNNRHITAETPLMAMEAFSDSYVEFLAAKTVRSGCGASSTNKTWTCQGSGAAKCMLGPCVRTYNGSIVQNQISEQLVDHSDPRLQWQASPSRTGFPGNTSTADYVLGLVDLACVSTADKQSIAAQNYTFNSTTRWLPYSFNYTAGHNDTDFPASLLTHRCLYLYSTFFIDSMYSVFLYAFYTGTLLGTVQSTDQLINSYGPRLLEVTYDNANGSFETIDSTFSSMATYLTDYIRQNGNPSFSESAQGTVNHYATCVQVNWNWLVLPAALAILVFALFIWLVTAVNTSGAPVWKSLPLALMFRGPEDVDTSDNTAGKRHVDDLDELEDVAKGTVVHLGRSTGTLRLER
jgi:hypothetical protein